MQGAGLTGESREGGWGSACHQPLLDALNGVGNLRLLLATWLTIGAQHMSWRAQPTGLIVWQIRLQATLPALPMASLEVAKPHARGKRNRRKFARLSPTTTSQSTGMQTPHLQRTRISHRYTSQAPKVIPHVRRAFEAPGARVELHPSCCALRSQPHTCCVALESWCDEDTTSAIGLPDGCDPCPTRPWS